jgi:hypothetical protein
VYCTYMRSGTYEMVTDEVWRILRLMNGGNIRYDRTNSYDSTRCPYMASSVGNWNVTSLHCITVQAVMFNLEILITTSNS